jgi:predicted lactoylglutathione lyase
MKSHKLYEHLGFGFLAMFRSVRFICFIFLGVCFFMLLSGIAFLKTSTEYAPGYTTFDVLSIAN